MNEKGNQEDLFELYNYFSVDYNFKQEKVVNSLEKSLKNINSLAFSKFKPQLIPRTAIVETMMEELQTKLSLNFENYGIILKKNSLSVAYPEGFRYALTQFKLMPQIFADFDSFIPESNSKHKLSEKELDEMNDIIKLNLIQKMFNINDQIQLESIDIFAMIQPSKSIDFKAFDANWNEKISDNKVFLTNKIEFVVRSSNNTFTILINNQSKYFMSFATYRDNLEWKAPLVKILNENLQIHKQIFEEIGLWD